MYEKLKQKYINFDSDIFKLKYLQCKSLIVKIYSEILRRIIKNKGPSIFFLVLLLYIINGNLLINTICGSILYLMILANRLLNHKMKKDRLNMINLKEFNDFNKIDGNENILDIYINDIFSRYIILNEGTINSTYINEKTEKAMLKALLDQCARNMSKDLRDKLMLYYGTEGFPNIMTEKCYIKVSLYAANINKSLYAKAPNLSDVLKKMW